MVSLAMMDFGDGRSLDVVEGCKWLTLAQRLRPQNQEDARRVDAEWSTRCGALTRETREKVEEKVGAWVPKEIWYERKQARFRQILDEAAKEDLARQAAGK